MKSNTREESNAVSKKLASVTENLVELIQLSTQKQLSQQDIRSIKSAIDIAYSIGYKHSFDVIHSAGVKEDSNAH